MLRLLKVLVVLALAGFIALTGYAYLGDITPERQEETRPVTLDAG